MFLDQIQTGKDEIVLRQRKLNKLEMHYVKGLTIQFLNTRARKVIKEDY